MEIGERIRGLREAKGLTRYKVTQITGVSGQHIKGIEEGTRQPTIDTLEKIAASLGVTLAEIFSDGESAYLSERERRLIENFRTMSEEKSEVLLILSDVLKK